MGTGEREVQMEGELFTNPSPRASFLFLFLFLTALCPWTWGRNPKEEWASVASTLSATGAARKVAA